MKLVYGVLVLILIVSGCAHQSRNQTLQPPEFPLLAPSTLAMDINAVQSIEVDYQGQSLRFQGVVRVNHATIQMIVLSGLGQRIASLTYDGSELTLQRHSELPEQFPLRYMLESLQMMYWPVSTLAAHQSDAGWRFDQTQNLRSIYFRSRPVVLIEYQNEDIWQTKTTLRHQLFDFQLSVTSAVLPESNL